MQSLLPGDPTTLGRYRLLGRIGVGGMGVVYLAETPGRVRVALKVIHPHLAADRTFRTRFAREVISTRRVEGLCTARVLDADVDGPIPYLVTEFIDGPSLAEELRAHGPLTGERLDALAAGLAEALTSIHAVGLVHRDLKPANVLLATAGPKVIDFGIASLLDDTAMTASGVVVGTPTWLAPEQLLDQPVTPALDVFMWGSVVTFAGTGNPPFGTNNPEAYGAQVLQAEPNLTGLPTHLAALVTRALSKDPRSRPTAQQLLATLAGGSSDDATAQATRLLNGWAQLPYAETEMVATSAGRTDGPNGRRGRWLAAGAAAALALIAAGVLVGIASAGGKPAAPPVSQPTTDPITTSSPSPTVPSTAPSAAIPTSVSPAAGWTPSADNPITTEVWGSNAVPFASPAPVSYTKVPLTRRATSGVSVLVPAGWALSDESIPSDHSDAIFYDPANPAARFEVSSSACVGCVTGGGIPGSGPADPAQALPPHAISSFMFDHGLSDGFQETSADGYTVNGVVQVLGTLAQPQGYVLYRVVLPPADTPLATRILNSVQITN